MRTHSRWPTLAVFFVSGFASGCVQSTNGESAESSSNGPAANVQSAPLMTVNQLMHVILFPLGNTVFWAQAEDPAALPRDPMPSSSPNPLTGLYGGWQAVENSALALAESADLLLIEGRMCSNGEVVNVGDADWIRFVDDYREKSVAAYEAALRRTRTRWSMRAGFFRNPAWRGVTASIGASLTPGDARQRCIPVRQRLVEARAGVVLSADHR